jgi:hypothetical protein
VISGLFLFTEAERISELSSGMFGKYEKTIICMKKITYRFHAL